MHDSLREIYKQLLVSPLLIDRLNDRVDSHNRADREAKERSQEALRERLAVLETQGLRVATALAEGTMEPDVYRLVYGRIVEEQELLSRRIDRVAPTKALVVMPELRTLWQLHQALSLSHQRDLVQVVFEDLAINCEGVMSYRLTRLASVSKAA